MDILTLVGLVLALAAIVGGSVLKGAGVAGLVSGAAFVIVIVGTIAAIFVQTPLKTFKRSLRLISWIFKPPAHDGDVLIRNVVDWSNTARKHGLLGLETQVEAGRGPGEVDGPHRVHRATTHHQAGRLQVHALRPKAQFELERAEGHFGPARAGQSALGASTGRLGIAGQRDVALEPAVHRQLDQILGQPQPSVVERPAAGVDGDRHGAWQG